MISMTIGGTLAEMMGRKRTLIIGQLCILIGWAVVYFAKTFLYYYLEDFLLALELEQVFRLQCYTLVKFH